MLFLLRRIRAQSIIWKHIDEYAHLKSGILSFIIYKPSSLQHNFGKLSRLVRIVLRVGNEVPITKLILSNSHKPIIILAWHTNVDIIIPWNESSMANGTKN